MPKTKNYNGVTEAAAWSCAGYRFIQVPDQRRLDQLPKNGSTGMSPPFHYRLCERIRWVFAKDRSPMRRS